MSSKWPAKLFSYHPRVPVSTDAEEEAPPAPSPESVEASSSPPVLPEPNHAATEETTLTAPVEHEARLVERARTHPEAFGQLYDRAQPGRQLASRPQSPPGVFIG